MIPTIIAVAVSAVASICLLMGASVAAFSYLRRNPPLERSSNSGLELRIAELEIQIKGLPSLWEEERLRAKRSQQAAEAARKSAEEKLEQVAGIIDEEPDVLNLDDRRSEQSELSQMRQNMGVTPQAGIEDRLAEVAHLLM
jgi:hypothetical protein